MRKWALLLILLIAAGAIFAGCAQNKAQNQVSSVAKNKTSQSVQASSVVIGVTDKVTDLDPANAYDAFTWEILENTMVGLVKYKPGTLKIEPALAESWEVKNNSTVWIFHLRKGLKFSDGTPLTAKNVVWSIERVMRIKGDPSWLVTDFVKKVVAENNTTVIFYLKHPTSYFLALLTTPPYYPVNPKYSPDKIDSDQTAGGAGPYKIVKFVRGQEIVLEANPYYFGQKPKTQKIIVRFYRDATTMRLALQNGEIDVAWRTLRPSDIISLEKSNFNVVKVPGTYIRYLCFNVKKEPTSSVLVRRALAAAINRSEIASMVYRGTVEPLYSLIPNGMWSHLDVFKKYGDGNVKLAQQLLEKAGYSKSKPLHIQLWYTPTHYGDTEADLAQMIKSQWESTGMVKVTIKSAEWGTYVDYARKGQMQAYLLGWYPDYLDPDDYTTPFLSSTANTWAGTGFANKTVDSLLKKAQQIPNQDERAKIYEEVQKILADQVPYVPLVQGNLFVVTKPNVHGVTVGPDMVMEYAYLYRT